MASYLFDLLIKPDAFFQKRMAEKENLVKPALIILAGAILGAVAGYLTSSLTSKMMGWAGLGTGFAVAFSVIGAFIGIFVTWAIVTGIFYVISLVFNGNGSFFRCLGVIGYGFLPRVIGSLIIFVVTIVYIPLISVPSDRSGIAQKPAGDTGRNKNAHERSYDDTILPDYHGSLHYFPALERILLDLWHETRTAAYPAECGNLRGSAGHPLHHLCCLCDVPALYTFLGMRRTPHSFLPSFPGLPAGETVISPLRYPLSRSGRCTSFAKHLSRRAGKTWMVQIACHPVRQPQGNQENANKFI